MRPRPAVAAILLIVAAGLSSARAQDSDGFWSAGAGGSWASAANWDSGTIADGADNTAFFGINLEPPITATNAVFTLNGARTIGYINFYGPVPVANWTLSTGSGGPLTLNTTFDVPAIYVNPSTLQLTMSTVVAGTNGLEKTGSGTLLLTATNFYTGGTTVTAGGLLVNGILNDANPVIVSSGTTLGGTGVISGPLVIQTSAAFSPGIAPGNSTGTFAVNNSLTLQAGSTTAVNVNAASLSLLHTRVTGISSAAYAGTLSVTNLAGNPVAGQSFQLFSAAGSSGDFSGIVPQLTGGVRWKFNPSSGVLSVVATNSQPAFAALGLAANTLVLTITNGVPGATNYLLAATNLAQSRATWSRLATNVFDAGGNLVLSNTVSAITPRRFFLISTAP